MYEASRPVLLFDYFRVPYAVRDGDRSRGPVDAPDLPPSAWIAVDGSTRGPRLWWLPAESSPASAAGLHRLGTIPVFGRVTCDAPFAEPLRQAGWQPLLPIVDAAGRPHSSLWGHPDRSVLLPFDPGEVITTFWSERYRDVATPRASRAVMGVARRGYYRLRPLLPRGLQVRLRQGFAKVQGRAAFPRWPVEPALHDLYALLFDLVAQVAGRPVPYVSTWPKGRSWAFVLSHDVETAAGYDQLHLLCDLERTLGMRSSWNFVPRRYHTDDAVVGDLRADGFEVGVHGLYHDGRDFSSERTFRARLPAVHDHARRWGAVGFRSPALHRVWEWMPELQFAYDSSYPDTDPFQPQPGGCCSLLPYLHGDLVELPITLAQDFVMFELLQHVDETLWVEKLAYVRDRGGMALCLSHPDYMMAQDRRDAYERLLRTVTSDATAWHALPREVAAWWRRRHASSLEQDGAGWRVAGPASDEASVAFAGAPDLEGRR